MHILKEIDKIILLSKKNKCKKVIFFLSSFFATGCFVGKIKYAPGTFGSLLAIFFCIPFVKFSLSLQLVILGLLLLLGILTTHLYLLKLGDLIKDPKEVVIDEILAVFMITFLVQGITVSLNWQHFLSIFALFRVFDIIKPYPICWVDKNIHGAIGIMLDDILAGFGSVLIYIIAYA